jgi:transcriptional regulator with XRE-family HTH domain
MAQRFGEKLTQLRQEKSFTQTELARQLGSLSRAHIANLEKGRDAPSLSIAVQLAMYLDVTIDSLLRDDREVEARANTSNVPGHALEGKLSFGPQLSEVRLQRNITQWQLAQALQLESRAYVSDLERGQRLPSIELVIKIADFFQVTADSLLHIDQPIANTDAARTSDEPAASPS